MKQSNPLVSIVITTYNRYGLLKKIINDIYKQTYKNIEIIVSDDCSTDNTYEIKNLFPKIKYIKTTKNLGYAKNSKFALKYANGEYLAFFSDDDKLVYDGFIETAVEKLQNSDLFIAKSAIKYHNKLYYKKYNFKEKYKKYEFFEFLKDINFYYVDFFSFSSCIFKTDIFKSIEPFETLLNFACDVDTASIFKYLDKCENIYFFDKIVYLWTRPNSNSISGNSSDDMAYHVLQMISSSLNIRKNITQDIYKKYYNGYVEFVFEAIKSDFYLSNRNYYFNKLLKKLDRQNIFYIYGAGMVGLELKKILDKNGFKVSSFIDDYRKGEDIIELKEFIKNPKDVIIASFKYRDIYNIYKKISKFDIEIFDLFGEAKC